MSNGYVQVPPDSTGRKVDAASLSVAGVDVVRQRVVLGSDTDPGAFALVLSAAPATTDAGVVVRNIPSGTYSVDGKVVISGTALVAGTVTISNPFSGLVSITGTVALAAGTSLIGDINAISRTVQVAIGTPFTVNNISAAVVLAAGTANIGAVSLAAGTANIGLLNSISRTVDVAIATPFTLQGISTTVQVAIQTPFTIQGISTTVMVAGSLTVGGFTDNTTYSTGVSTVSPAGFIFFSASATAVTDGRCAAGRITDARGQHVNLRNNAGTEVGTAAAPLSVKIENTSATASVVLAAGAANIGTINNISAAVAVTGTVSLGAGTNLIGAVSNAAGTALMGAVSLAAGTANIGFINNISATVIVAGEVANGSSLSTTNKPVLIGGNDSAGGAGGVMRTLLMDTSGRIILGAGSNNIGAVSVAAGTALMGAVSLAAGTANIGFINNISAPVVLAAGTANIGAVSNAAGTALMGAVSLAAGTANIGFINNISAPIVLAAGTANIGAVSLAAGTALVGAVSLAAGTANIGFLNNISATVTCVVAGFTPAVPSVSHGPATITCSTSAVVVLVANPGDGLSTYITQLVITNMGTVSTLARLGTSASTSYVLVGAASGGGGAVIAFNPPWKLSASATAIASVKPNSSGNVYFMVNWFTAA